VPCPPLVRRAFVCCSLFSKGSRQEHPHLAHYYRGRYDGLTLVMKAFRPWWTVDLGSSKPVLGTLAAQAAINNYLCRIVDQGTRMPLGGAPVIIGESGIPFDIGGKAGFDLSLQIQALDRTMQAMQAALVSVTLWNYTPDNTADDGDRWNGEDLSVFSREWQFTPDDLYSGGRALPALVRPYARKVCGTPLSMTFSTSEPNRRFTFTFRHTDGISASTEIFVPHYQYPDGPEVTISDGEFRLDEQLQSLFYIHSTDRAEHTITLSLKTRKIV
jgi:hypothetical protein